MPMKMVTVYIDKREAREFKTSVEKAGLDMSKVVRQFVSEYLKKDQGEIERSAEEIKRAEMHEQIVAAVKQWGADNASKPHAIRGMEMQLDLAEGTISALLREG